MSFTIPQLLFFLFLGFFISLFILFLLLFFVLSFFFFKKDFTRESNSRFLLLYKFKVEDFSYMYIDVKTKNIYYNWNFLANFYKATSLYYTFFGYWGLQKLLYSRSDYITVSKYMPKPWNCFYNYLSDYLPQLNIDDNYWINFFVSLYLFIIILSFYTMCPDLLLDDLYLKIFLFRIAFILIVGITILFLFIFFAKEKDENIWKYDSYYVKILIFLWKFFEDLGKILIMFMNFFFNIYLFFFLFSYIDMSRQFSFTLVTYGLIIILSLFVNLLFKHLNKISNNKIVVFLADNKIQSIFSFPLPSILLFFLLKVYWWFSFILSFDKESHWVFLIVYLKILYKEYMSKHKDYSEYELIKQDKDVLRLLKNRFWFNDYSAIYIWLFSKVNYKYGLKKRRGKFRPKF